MTVVAMVTLTAIETGKVTAGGSGNTAIMVTETAMAVMVAGS